MIDYIDHSRVGCSRLRYQRRKEGGYFVWPTCSDHLPFHTPDDQNINDEGCTMSKTDAAGGVNLLIRTDFTQLLKDFSERIGLEVRAILSVFGRAL